MPPRRSMVATARPMGPPRRPETRLPTRRPHPDAGTSCTPATVGLDCPARPCELLTGCVGNVCQYVPAGVCVARSFSGTFVTGDFEATVDGTTVRGQIGPFLQEQGATCVGTTCVRGDLLP